MINVGTKQEYKVYQRKDIDWNHIRTHGPIEYRGKSNRDAAKFGLAPQLKDGNFVTLHHLGQDSRGGLVEASTKQHSFGGKKLDSKKTPFDILHSQHGIKKKNPMHPVDHKVWSKEQKEYWKWRAINE